MGADAENGPVIRLIVGGGPCSMGTMPAPAPSVDNYHPGCDCLKNCPRGVKAVCGEQDTCLGGKTECCVGSIGRARDGVGGDVCTSWRRLGLGAALQEWLVVVIISP